MLIVIRTPSRKFGNPFRRKLLVSTLLSIISQGLLAPGIQAFSLEWLALACRQCTVQCLVYEYAADGTLAGFFIDDGNSARLSAAYWLTIVFKLARAVSLFHTGGFKVCQTWGGNCFITISRVRTFMWQMINHLISDMTWWRLSRFCGWSVLPNCEALLGNGNMQVDVYILMQLLARDAFKFIAEKAIKAKRSELKGYVWVGQRRSISWGIMTIPALVIKLYAYHVRPGVVSTT